MELQVLERSRLWTPEIDKLLRRWRKQVEIRRRGHYDIARKWNNRHYRLGVPAAILSAVVTTGTLSTFRNCSDSEGSKCDADQWIRLLIGVFGIINTTMTATQTFMNYHEGAESHKSAADDYESLYGIIESLFSIPVGVRGDPVTALHGIRSKYDETVKKSPNLPQEYQVELSFTTVDSYRTASNRLSPQPERAQLQPVDVDTSTSPSSESIEARIKQENDFDSEDDQEVCLGFDLDQMIAMNNTPAAIAVVRMAALRDQQVHTSAANAIQFGYSSTPTGSDQQTPATIEHANV